MNTMLVDEYKDTEKPSSSLINNNAWVSFFPNCQLFVDIFAHVSIEKCILKIKITFNVDIFILGNQ